MDERKETPKFESYTDNKERLVSPNVVIYGAPECTVTTT